MKDVENFIKEASELIREKKSNYEIISNETKEYLDDLLSDYQGVTISSRIKDENKLGEKIHRKNYFNKFSGDAKQFVDELPDGIGIRVVCLLNEDENKIYKSLVDKLIETKDIDGKIFNYNDEKYLFSLQSQPEKQKNGNSIYRIDLLYRDESNQVRMELQIKSLTHYFWGEIEHSLFYKNYNFTINSDFYARLMQSIFLGLNNIDTEMSTLKDHMTQSCTNNIKELRQMAALMIAKKYDEEIKAQINCGIDLREVYILLVDLYFGTSLEETYNLKRYSSLVSKLEKSKKIEDLSYCNELNIDVTSITPKNQRIASLIDQNIHNYDVYWKYLLLTYSSIFVEDKMTYSEHLQELADVIGKLYVDTSSAADMLIAENKSDIKDIVNEVILVTAEQVKKISYFILDDNLKNVKKIIERYLRLVEKCIYKDGNILNEEEYSSNKETIKFILLMAVYAELELDMDISVVNEVIDAIQKNNDYDLYLDIETIDKLKNIIEEEKFEIIDRELREERIK